ncbi:MAG: hypothetical protein JWO20_1557 [Candidatus Angelobacter sp.]|nr:hypothetical protein [Candidatus Angelobacter sp.]
MQRVSHSSPSHSIPFNDRFNSAARSLALFTIADGLPAGLLPTHRTNSSRDATTWRPCRLTGIPSFAKRCAVETGSSRNSAISAHPLADRPALVSLSASPSLVGCHSQYFSTSYKTSGAAPPLSLDFRAHRVMGTSPLFEIVIQSGLFLARS